MTIDSIVGKGVGGFVVLLISMILHLQNDLEPHWSLQWGANLYTFVAYRVRSPIANGNEFIRMSTDSDCQTNELNITHNYRTEYYYAVLLAYTVHVNKCRKRQNVHSNYALFDPSCLI